MDSFDRVAIFNFPLSFPIESVHEGDIKQLVRPSFPRLSVRLMRSPPWYTGIFHAILSTPVSPAKRHHGAVSSRGCVGHEFVKLESCLFPFPPPPPILHFPPRFSTALLDSRVDHRGRNNVGEHAFERTLTTIRVDVCCYFFPRFQFSIRGKKNMAETLRRIQFRRCTVEGVVGVIFNLLIKKVETRNDSHAFPICAWVIEKRLGL